MNLIAVVYIQNLTILLATVLPYLQCLCLVYKLIRHCRYKQLFDASTLRALDNCNMRTGSG